MMQFIFTHIL